MESTNSAWRNIRELPPLQLLNGLYQWTLTTFFKRQQLVLVPGNSVLSNTAYQNYKHRESAARGFQVQPSSDTRFLVTTSRAAEFIVTLPATGSLHLLSGIIQGHCTCLKYQEYLAPCSHAIACIQYLGFDPYLYFYPVYKWEVLKRTYQLPVRPLTLQGLQPLEGNQLLPPIKKVKRGRPKTARIRTNYKLDKRITHCSICHQTGHNRRVCPNQPLEHGRAQRARDQLVEDSNSASFSDWSGCSNTTSEVIEVDQDQVDQDQVDQDQVNQDYIDDIWWSNLQYEESVQDQGVQDQEVQLRRYPLRKRQLTVKAAALARE